MYLSVYLGGYFCFSVDKYLDDNMWHKQAAAVIAYVCICLNVYLFRHRQQCYIVTFHRRPRHVHDEF